MLVDGRLVQLSVHQLPYDNLRVTVFLKAEVAAIGKAAFYRGAGKNIACDDLMHHDAAVAFRANGVNAVAKRVAALNLSPRGESGLHHLLRFQHLLNLCDPFCRTLHQIFLSTEQIAVVMPPVIVAIGTSPGDKIIGNMLADAKDKFGISYTLSTE